MIAPRWRKVWRDLALDWPRTGLAVVALALGTFGVGADLAARAILDREVDRSFSATRPPSVVLHLEAPGADRALAREVEALPGVQAAEARGSLEARMLAGPDRWKRVLLFVVDDFQALQVSTFRAEAGAAAPGPGEVLLERSAVPFLQRAVGDTLVLQTPSGPRTGLTVVGVVHDGAQSPGWMDGIGYAYLTPATLALLGEGTALPELRVLVRPGADPAEVGRQARAVAERRGGKVSFVDVRQATRHPHADQMASLLYLFGAFGALSLLLGGLLAATVVATLLRRQLPQLGVMKAVGASTGQLAAMSLGGVLLLALAALAVSVPGAVLAGRAYATFVGGVLNLEVRSLAIPAWVPLVQASAGLLVPLLAAVVPVLRVSRLTVLEALAGGAAAPGGARADGWRPAWLDRPTWLSLRNLLRAPGRLALTVGMLAIGGATFVSALSVSASWRNTVDALFQARRYQLQVVFSRPVPADRARAVLGAVEGVGAVETWASAVATVVRPGPEEVRFTLTGLPPDTAMVAYPVLEGRWLRPGDTGALVINHELAQDPEAGLRLGDRVELEVAGRRAPFTVVGVVRELGVRRRGQHLPASAYVSRDQLEALAGLPGLAASAVLSAPGGGEAALEALSARVERALDQASLARTIVQPSTHRRRELLDHLVIIRDFLLAMAALVAAVGGLALGAARSLDVLERRRELGVMRALGASPGQLTRLVLVEGAAVAAASWLLALALAHPLGRAIGDFAGRIFVHAPLDQAVSVPGVVGWLAVAVAIATLAAVLPLRRALRRPVAQALRTE